MRRNKAVLITGLALATSLALAACGGGNSNPGSSNGGSEGTLQVAFVPKIQGIPFFEAMNSGGKKASEEFGFKWVYSGATSADPAAQADVVRSLIQQSVDSISVAPNDPNSMAPVFVEAQKAGIVVATADTDAPESIREYFVSQASEEGIGTALAEQVLTPMGGKGKLAIVSCGQTAANLNAWIEVIKETVATDYPNAEIVDVVYADEDQARAVTMAKDLMNAHPDLTGLIGPCTTAAPGIAQAIDEAGKIGKVFSTGVGTPQAMLPYLESGASSASVLWNVEDHGYLTAWAGWQAAQGIAFPANAPFDAGHLKGLTYDADTKVLLLGTPLILTADNAGDFSY